MTFITRSVACATLILLHAAAAGAAFNVPGTANPNLAGRADGYSCCSGDSVPGQSPVQVTAIDIDACARLSFAVSGKVSYVPSSPMGDNPDGDEAFSMTNYGDGISAPANIRANALVGVFLGEEAPTGQTTPAQLDFGAGLDFHSIAPAVGQIFFIGDGLTSDTNAGMDNGVEQTFTVPPDATRLFLGTADGTGWFNNSGSFTVDVASTPEESPFECGDPADPPGVTATDALLVLRAAVGSALCLECVCDVDASGATVATDALAVLRHAVGQEVPLLCSCCGGSIE
ncbi:MAG TPA: hypothetical protein VEC57_11630 [Candidatus Limnocylindrales bacterium]|nr:hypothetical protein [Candidatus Limnocylindrales bacterium]